MSTYTTQPYVITFDTSGRAVFYSPCSFSIWYHPSYPHTSAMNPIFKVKIEYLIDPYDPTIKEKLNKKEKKIKKEETIKVKIKNKMFKLSIKEAIALHEELEEKLNIEKEIILPNFYSPNSTISTSDFCTSRHPKITLSDSRWVIVNLKTDKDEKNK